MDALDFGSNEAIIINEGNLTIASRVTGSNTTTGLTKNGAGRLTLAGASSFSGLIDVFQGVLRLQNSAILNVTVRAGAAIELLGGVTTNGSSWAIIGNGPDGRGGLRSVSGDNRIGSLLLLSSSYNIDVASGSLTVAGNLSSNALVKTGVGTLTVMGPAGSSTPTVLGGGTLASTYQFGAPFGTSPVTLNGSTLRFSPVHASTGVVSINVGAISYKGGASTLAIDKGTNASLTLTVGPSGGAGAFVRTGPATLLIAPAGGLAALGVTEKIKLNSTLDTAFPTINGIVSTSIIGQDTDANHSGDFLGYTAATGLKPTTYSTSTNLNTAATTAVFNATTPQTLTRNVMVYALKNSGQTIDLAGRALSIGGQSYSREALILNGGSILGGSLVFSGTSIADVYTSLAGGTISSTVTGSGYGSGAFAKFGPGTLTLSGTTRVNILVESGGLKLDGPLPESLSSVAGSVTLARGATLSGAGRVSGTVAGGLISPGNGAGTLAANSTGSADTTNSGLNESFAPTSFAFEFTRLDAPLFGVPTASGNDLLRLTSATAPFSSALTADDEIDIYLSIAGGVRPGDSFLGRFYTDLNASFVSSIANANYRYFLRDDLGGTHFNGAAYSERTDLPFEIDSIPQIANFGSGEVNGYIMQVRVVPEPSALLLVLAGSFAIGRGARPRRK